MITKHHQFFATILSKR